MTYTFRAILILTVAFAHSSTVASAGDLVRVDFQNESSYAVSGGIFGEDPDLDLFECGTGDNFDLVDIEDDNYVCSPYPMAQGISQSDISGGGRWKLSLVSGVNPVPVRAVGINFSDTDTSTGDADCAALADIDLGRELGGGACACGSTCFVQMRISADRVFKKGATRQALSIEVLKQNSLGDWPPQLNIDYVDPLYICADPDKDVRWLQTDSCDGFQTVREAEIDQVSATNGRTPLGRWNMPLKLRLSRVSRPTTDGGGTGGSCSLTEKGGSCSENGECCSGRCSGKRGSQVCK